MSFVDKVKASQSDLLYLVRGKDQGHDAWHYVMVDRNKLPLFKRQLETSTIDVSKYGEILYSGWGQDPPQDIVDKIEEQYG